LRAIRTLIVAIIVGTLALTSFSYVGIGAAGDREDLSAIYPSAFLAATDPETFTKATIGEPDYLDPAVDYETSGGEILQNVYETLVWYDRSSMNLVPLLAVEIPTVENGLISADGMTYTFHVRSGITFHDGTALTADDVAYSIQRVLRIHDPYGPSWMLEQVLTDYVSYSLGSELQTWATSAQWLLDAIGTTDPYHIITEDDIQKVAEAAAVNVDDMTVMFRLTHPYSGFLGILASTVGSVVSKDYVEAHGGVQNGWQNDWMNTHACGTGPYMLVNWAFGDRIDLTRFDGYRGMRPLLSDIHILSVNDVNQRYDMLVSGAADTVYLPQSWEPVIAGDPNIRVVKGLPTFEMTFIAFDLNFDSATAGSMFGSTIPDDFFADVHVRRAFASLMNYSLYIQNAFSWNAIQPNGVIPRGMFGYDNSIPLYTYDLAVAQSELQLAINPTTGNSWWYDGFTVPLFFNAGNVARQIACEIIATSLNALGTGQLKATVNALDWPSYLDQVYNPYGYIPLYSIGWWPDYADPDDYAAPMLDSVYGIYTQYTDYQNPDIEALLRQAASEPDPAVRAELYSQMAALVYGDVPYIWLAQLGSFHVERTWVNGYYFNPMYGGLYYAALSKSPPIVGTHVTKTTGNPSTRSASWTYTPVSDGTWTASIESSGLKYLVLDVYDVSSGVQVLHQKVHLSVTSATFSMPVPMTSGHTYKMVATPVGGAIGSSVIILDLYV
jgi:peptide/nickel transport system substrate-binding protein